VVIATIIACRRNIVVRSAGIFAGAMTLLSLGPYLHVGGHHVPVRLPWLFVTKIPLLRDIQANRLMVYVYLAVAILLAFALGRLWRRRGGLILVAAVAVLVLLPLIPRPPLAQSVSAPAYFSSAALEEIPAASVVLTVPFPSAHAPDGITWQIASDLRFKIVGGYIIGAASPGQDHLKQEASILAGQSVPRRLDARHRSLFTRQLRQSDVAVIVMGPVPHRGQAVSVLSDALGFAPH